MRSLFLSLSVSERSEALRNITWGCTVSVDWQKTLPAAPWGPRSCAAVPHHSCYTRRRQERLPNPEYSLPGRRQCLSTARHASTPYFSPWHGWCTTGSTGNIATYALNFSTRSVGSVFTHTRKALKCPALNNTSHPPCLTVIDFDIWLQTANFEINQSKGSLGYSLWSPSTARFLTPSATTTPPGLPLAPQYPGLKPAGMFSLGLPLPETFSGQKGRLSRGICFRRLPTQKSSDDTRNLPGQPLGRPHWGPP